MPLLRPVPASGRSVVWPLAVGTAPTPVALLGPPFCLRVKIAGTPSGTAPPGRVRKRPTARKTWVAGSSPAMTVCCSRVLRCVDGGTLGLQCTAVCGRRWGIGATVCCGGAAVANNRSITRPPPAASGPSRSYPMRSPTAPPHPDRRRNATPDRQPTAAAPPVSTPAAPPPPASIASSSPPTGTTASRHGDRWA
jgi:hypothetical protein